MSDAEADMSADTLFAAYGVVAVVIVLVGMTLFGLGKIDDIDAPMVLLLAVMWPLFCALTWPYWLARYAKWYRTKRIEDRQKRAAQVERDYQEVQRMIER